MTPAKNSQRRALCRSLTARLFAFSPTAAWARTAERWPMTRDSHRRRWTIDR